MNSGNALPENISSSNKSLITTLIKLRNFKGTFFNIMPDIAHHMIEIIKKLPVQNIFDTIASDLTAICHYYKNDYYLMKNNHHDLACEIEEVMKLFEKEKRVDKKHAFIHLIVFLQGLVDVLKTKPHGKFLHKIEEINQKYNLRIQAHLSPFCIEDAHKMGGHVSLSDLITTLSAYTAQSKSVVIAYLEDKCFVESNRKNLLANLNQRYKDVWDFSSYEAMNLATIEKEIDFHLNEDCNISSPRSLNKY